MKQIHWNIPKNLLNESITIMRPQGTIGNEGLALWFGQIYDSHIDITHIVEVSGAGFHTTPLYMNLSLRAMIKLTDLAEKIDSPLVGQIHSHPGRLIDLSILDKEQGIRKPNYLSVVCPYYAQRNLNDLNQCGVHVFEKGHYRRMPTTEISQRIKISDIETKKIQCEVPA